MQITYASSAGASPSAGGGASPSAGGSVGGAAASSDIFLKLLNSC